MSTLKERKEQTKDAVSASRRRAAQDKGGDTRQPGHLPGSMYFEQRYLGNNCLQSTEEESQIVRSDGAPPEVTTQEGTGKTIQAKLTVSQPGDKYEEEADRVAEAVTKIPGPMILHHPEGKEESPQARPLSSQITPLVQPPKTASQPPSVTSELESRIRALNGGGQPLPESIRAFFEPRFGYDFSQVRVHTEAQAAQLADALNAQAFTVGQNVVLKTGRCESDTDGGRRCLAHELTHVIQQSGWISGTVQRRGEEKERLRAAKLLELEKWYNKVSHAADKNSDLFKEAWIQLAERLLEVPEGLASITPKLMSNTLAYMGLLGGGPGMVVARAWAGQVCSDMTDTIDRAMRFENLEHQKDWLCERITEIFEEVTTEGFLKLYGAVEKRTKTKRKIETATSLDELGQITMPEEVPEILTREQVIAEVFQEWLLTSTLIAKERRVSGYGTHMTAKLIGEPRSTLKSVLRHAENLLGSREKLLTPGFAVRYYIALCKRHGIRFEEKVDYEDMTSSKKKSAIWGKVPCKVRAVELIRFPTPAYFWFEAMHIRSDTPSSETAEIKIPESIEVVRDDDGQTTKERIYLIPTEQVPMWPTRSEWKGRP